MGAAEAEGGVGPTFFVEAGLGAYRVPDALEAAGASVERHRDHVPADAPDADWIRLAAGRGWVALTKDRTAVPSSPVWDGRVKMWREAHDLVAD